MGNTERTTRLGVVKLELLAHVQGKHRDAPHPGCAACKRDAQRAATFVTRNDAFRAAQAAVRNQGYAVAKHGSEIRDLDLVAIPWRETAISAQRCAEIIAKAIPGVLLEPVEEKPYGRLAWEIHPLASAGHQWGHGFDHWYIDLSVMPGGGL
jgi:hypothetical protein